MFHGSNSVTRVRESSAPSCLQRGLVGEQRRQPVGGARGERFVGEVGPFVAFGLAQEHDAVAPLIELLAPGQPVDAGGCNRLARASWRFRPRARPARSARTSAMAPSRRALRPRRRSVAGSKVTSSRASIRSAKMRSISACEIAAASRMRACAAVPVNSAATRNGSRASDEGRIEHGAAAIGQQEAALPAAAILGDAIGIGEREERARRWHRRSRLRVRRHRSRPALRHAARILGAARAIAAELIEPMRQIDVVAAEAALGDQHRRSPRRARLRRRARHRPPCARAAAAAAARAACGLRR